jgi:hypothetical protein
MKMSEWHTRLVDEFEVVEADEALSAKKASWLPRSILERVKERLREVVVVVQKLTGRDRKWK